MKIRHLETVVAEGTPAEIASFQCEMYARGYIPMRETSGLVIMHRNKYAESIPPVVDAPENTA